MAAAAKPPAASKESLNLKIPLAKFFALACILLPAIPAHAADIYRLENQSYPIGQKSLSVLESGTITNGLVVRVLKNGQPAANELVRFHLSHSAGSNAKIEPFDVLTDKDGIARTNLRVGDKAGDYIV